MLKIQPQKATFKRKRDNYTRKKIKKLVKYLRSELGSSAIHGLPYTVKPELHWFERLCWAASFVFCAAFVVLLQVAQFERYLAAPTLMSVEKDYFNWNVSFPAITLCPLYKIDEELQAAFFNEFTLPPSGQHLGDDLGPYLEAITFASLDSIHLLQIPSQNVLSLINSADYASIAAQIFRNFYNTSVASNAHWPIDVEPVMTEMGMCHTINSNVAVFDNPGNWAESGVGKSYAKHNIDLSFHDRDFFVEIMDYADSYKFWLRPPSPTNTTKALTSSSIFPSPVKLARKILCKSYLLKYLCYIIQVYTQSSNDIILSGAPALAFDDEGFLSFGVQISSTKASPDVRTMGLHRRKCRFVDEPDTIRYPVYSYNRCLMQCRIITIKTLCGCVPHFYKPIGEKVCNLEELKCLINYIKELSTLSFGNLTEIYKLPKNSRECNCLGDCEQDYFQEDLHSFQPQEDMSKLKVFVTRFPKVRILREMLFSVPDIVLRSGGVVNLCIGASVISAMELLMTFIRIPMYRMVQRIKTGINFMYTWTLIKWVSAKNNKLNDHSQ